MKTKIIITTALLLCIPLLPLAAQEQTDKKVENFNSSNFYDNTFYKVMAGSSFHKVLTEQSSFYTYTPAFDFSIQGGKQFSKASSLYLSTAIQRYERTSGLRPRILFGEADIMYGLDLTNLCFGYNPHRVVSFSLNAGGGIDVVRTYGAWTMGSNLRGGASLRFNLGDKFGIVLDPYCKYMTGQLAREFVYDSKVFEHGALLGVQYTVYDRDRRSYRKSENAALWDQSLENKTGSAAEGSYFTLTAGTAYRLGTKKRYNMSYDFGFTVGHRFDKLNALNLGLLYEGYQKRAFSENDDITNPEISQAEFNLTHNINLTNAFYGAESDRTVSFATVEGLGLDILSDSHIRFGMNVHAGVEMDVKLSDHFSFIMSPVFKLWLGDVNFRDAGFDLACGGYVSAGLKYNVSNTRNKAKKSAAQGVESSDKGFDATKYALQKRYNPNEVEKERIYLFDVWTIQLLGGFGFLNPKLAEYKADAHGFLGMERRFGNFQWIQFGYGMGIATRKADGLQLMLNELDVNYRFSITNFINGIDNNKFVNVSAMAGTGLDFSYLEYDGTKLGTHLLLGFDLGFRVNERTKLLLDPYFKLMTDQTDHVKNWKGFDTCYGLSFGVRVDLDSKKKN